MNLEDNNEAHNGGWITSRFSVSNFGWLKNLERRPSYDVLLRTIEEFGVQYSARQAESPTALSAADRTAIEEQIEISKTYDPAGVPALVQLLRSDSTQLPIEDETYEALASAFVIALVHHLDVPAENEDRLLAIAGTIGKTPLDTAHRQQIASLFPTLQLVLGEELPEDVLTRFQEVLTALHSEFSA